MNKKTIFSSLTLLSMILPTTVMASGTLNREAFDFPDSQENMESGGGRSAK